MYVNAWVPDQQVPPIVDYFIKEKGAKTFFLIGSDYAFGRGMLEFTKAYIEKTGGKVVGEEYLPMDGTDWTPIICKLKSAAPGCADHLDRRRRAERHADQAAARRRRRRCPMATSRSTRAPPRAWERMRKASIISASYVTGIDSADEQELPGRHAEEVRRRTEDAERPLGAGVRGGLRLQGGGGEGRQDRSRRKVLKALAEVSFDGPRGKIEMSQAAPCAA